MKSLSPFPSKMQDLACVTVVPRGILASPFHPAALTTPSSRACLAEGKVLEVLLPVWSLVVLLPTSDTAVFRLLGFLQKLLASFGKLPSVNI